VREGVVERGTVAHVSEIRSGTVGELWLLMSRAIPCQDRNGSPNIARLSTSRPVWHLVLNAQTNLHKVKWETHT